MKVLRTTLILSIVFACVLGGCASTVEEIKPEDIADFRPGVTTQQQVVARLGTPSSTSTLQNGSTFLVYAFAQPQPLAVTLIPAIGPFVGDTSVRSTAISFQFGPDGMLNAANTVSSRFGVPKPH
ncbi:SmpA/OmlA family protein [Paraburkholderia sp. BL23I1N1]|uniref:outer membrane protein assembly factor BamE domain-containing protein n=1 Tax=Paraburkholderia sp. BL23I1N1 TaxID=1938802 RepID=UPI000FEDC248|nr:outer membrane protein assembly factor BamE [Paraburkholderia sp. BL23I1N1]RKE38444.1 SmpA/OmlA family protein [Paraburkholderia sp. BL23I1N1]